VPPGSGAGDLEQSKDRDEHHHSLGVRHCHARARYGVLASLELLLARSTGPVGSRGTGIYGFIYSRLQCKGCTHPRVLSCWI
jgi:hypothetical protein